MKRFLYYNQDSVNSFLAQIEQGLLVKDSAGEENEESFSGTTSTQSDITGDLSAKVLGIGTTLKGTLQGDGAETEATSNLIKSVQEKVLHDYAFDRVFSHVVHSGLIQNEDPQIGDIVAITDTPTFLDFNYFQSIFDEKGAMKLINDQQKKAINEAIDKLKGEIPKGTQMPVPIKIQIDALKNKANNAEPERRELLRMIEAIRTLLPYNRFVMTTNMLLPLDDEHFRDNPDIVAFKYGGKMTMFGYVTNIVSAGEAPERNNDFAPLYDAMNQIMLQMFKEQEKIYIVHPVALFY